MNAGVASDLESPHHAWLHESSQCLILSRRAEVFEQLLVWHCGRALSLVQARDAALFDELFSLQSLDLPALREAQKAGELRLGRPLPWLNRRVATLIVISEASRSIAASIYWLGPNKPRAMAEGKSIPVYENVALLRLNPAVILEEGSRNLYGEGEAPLYYLRDGVVESLIHESFHLRIAALNGADPVANAIHQAKQQKGKDSFGSGDGGTIEELFVVQSTEAIFESAPWKDRGVRPEVLRYYRDVMVKKYHWPRIEALDKSLARGPSAIFGAFAGKSREREIFLLPLARSRRGE